MSAPLGLIFDLDGTLADTLVDLCVSANAIRPPGKPEVRLEQARGLISFGARRMIRELFAPLDESEVESRLVAFRAHYARNLSSQTRLYDGWETALDRLSALRAPLAVLTNKPDAEANAICAKLLARWPIVAVRGWIEGGPAKPDPTVALELATQMGRHASEVIFLGDSSVDVETARRAGMTPIGVSWGFHSPDELLEAGARSVIASPVELVDLARGAC